jgi:hypothetical protein
MALVLRKSDAIPDWYVIERPGAFFGDAQVEGHGYEMRAIGRAIENRRYLTCGRCAVDARGDGEVRFWSPRNSRGRGGVSREEAEGLALEIGRVLPEWLYSGRV